MAAHDRPPEIDSASSIDDVCEWLEDLEKELLHGVCDSDSDSGSGGGGGGGAAARAHYFGDLAPHPSTAP